MFNVHDFGSYLRKRYIVLKECIEDFGVRLGLVVDENVHSLSVSNNIGN
jgi:hypothetical protein